MVLSIVYEQHVPGSTCGPFCGRVLPLPASHATRTLFAIIAHPRSDRLGDHHFPFSLLKVPRRLRTSAIRRKKLNKRTNPIVARVLHLHSHPPHYPHLLTTISFPGMKDCIFDSMVDALSCRAIAFCRHTHGKTCDGYWRRPFCPTRGCGA